MTQVERIQPERPVPPIALAAAYGDLLICTVVPEEPDGTIRPGSIEEQAERAFANLGELLRRLGSSLERVLHVTVYLADIEDRAGMTGVWERVFGPDYPARATVQVGLAHPDMRIELTVMAARG